MPDFESSQFLPPKKSGEPEKNPTSGTIEQSEPKADEHGTKKDAATGSTQTADSTKAAPRTLSPPAPGAKSQSSVTANKPNNNAVTSTSKISATKPQESATAKNIVEISTQEDDGGNGFAIHAKRQDGITLQFPMTFIGEKQDLYNTKNMFDLMGKLVKLTADELKKDYPTFVKG